MQGTKGVMACNVECIQLDLIGSNFTIYQILSVYLD